MTTPPVKCRRFCLCRKAPGDVLRVASDGRVALDVLTKLLRCRNDAVRAAVIYNSRMTGRGIHPLLSSPSPDERIIAVYRCSGYIPWRRYRRIARYDPDKAVRRAALEVLARHDAFTLAQEQKRSAARTHLQQAHRSAAINPPKSLPHLHPPQDEPNPPSTGAESYSGSGTLMPEAPLRVKLMAGTHIVKFRLDHNRIAKNASEPAFDALLIGIDHPETVEILTSRTDDTEGTWTETIHVGEGHRLLPGFYELCVTARGGGEWTVDFLERSADPSWIEQATQRIRKSLDPVVL